MNKRIIAAIAVASMVGVSHAALFTSGFDGNTGAHIFAGNTDNVTGSNTVSITDWTTDVSVTSISGLTAIHPAEGGGFAQTQGGAGTYAGPSNIYLSRNHNLGDADHGYSLTFTIDTSWDLTTLTVLSGHSTNTGNQDQGFTSDLNFSLSGGTLGAAVTGLSPEDYGTAPAYHSVAFDLTGTTIGAGTYTLQVYQNNNGSGSYAIYDGITLDGDNGAQQPAITSFDASSTNVFSGETVTLSWETTNADSLSLDQGIGDVSGATQIDVVVTADTTYTLIAVNGNGSATSSVPVTVIATPPVIQSFTASSTNVFSGAEVTLSWQVDDATGLSIDQGIGDVTGMASTQVIVTNSATYTLTATNVNGSVVESVEITLNQNPVLFSSDFDGNTGAEEIASADDTSGSTTLGITDWTTDVSVTAISDLTAISPGGGFVTMAGTAFASTDNVYINHNLNIADRVDPRGYSLTFTVDRSWNLGSPDGTRRPQQQHRIPEPGLLVRSHDLPQRGDARCSRHADDPGTGLFGHSLHRFTFRPDGNHHRSRDLHAGGV